MTATPVKKIERLIEVGKKRNRQQQQVGGPSAGLLVSSEAVSKLSWTKLQRFCVDKRKLKTCGAGGRT